MAFITEKSVAVDALGVKNWIDARLVAEGPGAVCNIATRRRISDIREAARVKPAVDLLRRFAADGPVAACYVVRPGCASARSAACIALRIS